MSERTPDDVVDEAIATIDALQAENARLTSEVARLREDAAIGQLVRQKMTSANAIPVERCTVRADEIDALRIGPFANATDLLAALAKPCS